nr:MAG TPA: hypothetical protein [Caudoviricetes sp.]
MLRKRKKQTSGERAFNGLRYEIKKKTNIMLLEEATQKPVRYEIKKDEHQTSASGIICRSPANQAFSRAMEVAVDLRVVLFLHFLLRATSRRTIRRIILINPHKQVVLHLLTKFNQFDIRCSNRSHQRRQSRNHLRVATFYSLLNSSYKWLIYIHQNALNGLSSFSIVFLDISFNFFPKGFVFVIKSDW